VEMHAKNKYENKTHMSKSLTSFQLPDNMLRK